MVPVLVHLAADPLRVLDAYAESLLRVRQVGVIENPEKKDRRVLFAHVDGRSRRDARRKEERQGRYPADAPPVMIVDLDERVVVPEGVHLADVCRFLDEADQEFAGLLQGRGEIRRGEPRLHCTQHAGHMAPHGSAPACAGMTA